MTTKCTHRVYWLLGRLERENELSINALGRAYRVQAGTDTAEKHHQDFEFHSEKFASALEELRVKLNCPA